MCVVPWPSGASHAMAAQPVGACSAGHLQPAVSRAWLHVHRLYVWSFHEQTFPFLCPALPCPALQLLISETLMKSMGSDSNGNGSSTAASTEDGAAGDTAAGEAAQQPPLRKVDIEELDDSAGGGDD